MNKSETTIEQEQDSPTHVTWESPIPDTWTEQLTDDIRHIRLGDRVNEIIANITELRQVVERIPHVHVNQLAIYYLQAADQAQQMTQDYIESIDENVQKNISDQELIVKRLDELTRSDHVTFINGRTNSRKINRLHWLVFTLAIAAISNLLCLVAIGFSDDQRFVESGSDYKQVFDESYNGIVPDNPAMPADPSVSGEAVQ